MTYRPLFSAYGSLFLYTEYDPFRGVFSERYIDYVFCTILTVVGTTHMSNLTAPHQIVSPHVLSTQCSQSQPRLGHVYINYSPWRYYCRIEREVHVDLASVTATQP